MISVRLSEEEYSALMNLCASSGARSVSDLARDAMRLLVGGGETGSPSERYAEGLQAQIFSLNQKIEALSERINQGHLRSSNSKSGNGAV